MKDYSNDFGLKISDLSDDDKPREKAINNGVDTLTNTELLAILFGSGFSGKSVISLSREILHQCDNKLDVLSRKSIKELMLIKGIGPAKAVTLAAAIEFGMRCRDERGEDAPIIKSADDAYRILRSKLERLEHEEVWALFLSRANKVLAKVRISSGGMTASVVDPKIVFKSALINNACGIILAHNHPSGNITPSRQDDDLTRKVKSGANLLEINLLDHLIVGNKSYYSYLNDGKL